MVIRRAHEGETIETLDHEKRNLTSDMLVIADANKAVAVAGVMGGVDSEVSEGTTSILLEGANFDMKSIRHTAKTLRLRTDASASFERGLDPNLAGPAMSRAADLILQLCPDARITHGHRLLSRPNRTSTTRHGLFADRTGPRVSDFPRNRSSTFSPDSSSNPRSPERPTTVAWRFRFRPIGTMFRSRTISWKKSPESLATRCSQAPCRLVKRPRSFRDEVFLLQRTLRGVLVGSGLSEAVTYVTISTEALHQFQDAGTGLAGLGSPITAADAVKMVNPLQAERPVLRPTIVPSLIESAAENLKHETSSRLFEFAKFFLPPDGRPATSRAKRSGAGHGW